jgi:hypothetical protein
LQKPQVKLELLFFLRLHRDSADGQTSLARRCLNAAV